MSNADLERFIKKVSLLQEMVESLDTVPGRRKVLAACNSHEQVIKLARKWGYDISRRWGEPD